MATAKTPTPTYDTTVSPFKEYKALFDSVDDDKSGAIDHEEFKALIKKLGMAASKTEVQSMITQADADGGGDIDINEFIKVIEDAKTKGATTADGRSFASVIERMSKSVQMKWDLTKFGKDVIIDEPTSTASRSGAGYAVAKLTPWMPDEHKYKRASLNLKVSELAGPLYIGVVGRNFQPDGAHWDQAFFPPTDASKGEALKWEKKSMVTAVEVTSGAVHVKGMHQSNSTFTAVGGPNQPSNLQIDIDLDRNELVLTAVGQDKEGNDTPVATVKLDNQMHEIGVAVCFGPTDPAAKTSVTIEGSSCESVQKHERRKSRDDTAVEQAQETGVNQAELNT